jgi:hypothetical protein
MKLKKSLIFNEFAVIGVFAVVAISGIFIGAISALTVEATTDAIVVPDVTAPTIIEYRTETRSVIAPFLKQIESVQAGSLAAEAADAIADLAARTQDRLLRVRVPGSERDAHLSLVIILDEWRTAARGSEADVTGVLERTAKLLSDYRWISPID